MLSLKTFPSCLLVCVLVGCGPRTVTVSGTVVFDGEPGQNISVLFQKDSSMPHSIQAAAGLTDEQGRFSLSLLDSRKSGAMPGDYVVYIVWKDPNATKEPVEGVTKANPCPYKIPARAAGRIRFTVPEGGTREADFIFDSSKEEPDEKPGV